MEEVRSFGMDDWEEVRNLKKVPMVEVHSLTMDDLVEVRSWMTGQMGVHHNSEMVDLEPALRSSVMVRLMEVVRSLKRGNYFRNLHLQSCLRVRHRHHHRGHLHHHHRFRRNHHVLPHHLMVHRN